MSGSVRQPVRMLFSPIRLAIMLIALTFTPVASVSAADRPLHTLTIKSDEAIQLAPKDKKEWYEQGWWPLLGAIGALIITNAVSVRIVYVQAEKSFNAVLRQRKIDGLSAALNEFYNPLLALIDINREIFSKTGPQSFPIEEPALSAAALIWKETRKKILANNAEIERILTTKSHLLQGTDTLDSYQALLVHVAMYETFQKIKTDLYKSFFFPVTIRDHVEKQRWAVVEAFNIATGDQI
jgi:uncharacterized membrane protein